MLRKRLKSVVSFIEKQDRIIDVGCDHAYLDIYVTEQKCCKSAIATDVNKNALAIAKKNIQKYQLEEQIPIILSDGIYQVDPNYYDTIVISGMGAKTILHILDTSLEHVKKIILQSNNDYPLLRKEMNKKGFYLVKEDIVEDHQKFYITMLFLKEGDKSSRDEILFGKSPEQNPSYIAFVLKSLYEMHQKIPSKKWLLRWKIKRYESHFQKYITKQRKQVD